MKNLNLFIPITKVDEEKRLVYGIATAEQPDQSGEICDYATTVPYYKSWSSRIEKASEGKSKGNLRAMHAAVAAGKVTQIEFNDTKKQIEICAKVVDADEWNKVLEGVYTGFSQGGRYVKTWKDGDYTRYTADPSEVSLVDNPCLPTATFTLLRAGGAAEMRKFKSLMENKMTKTVAQVWQSTDGSTHATKAEALQKNAEIDAASTAKPALDAVAEINKVLSKAEGEEERKDEPEEEKKEENTEEIAEKSAPVDLKKYIGSEVFDAAQAIDALCSIMALFNYESVEGEQDAGQLADLKIVIDRLKSFIASEIMENEMDEDDVLAMAAGGDLAKKGAKISASTKTNIDKMHKSASDHMATMEECYKAMGMSTEEAEKAATGDLEKVTKLEDENAALTKTITTLNSSVEAILARVKHLESQPVDGKGKLFRVEKGHEVQTTGNEPVETLQPNFSMPARISPEEYRRKFNV